GAERRQRRKPFVGCGGIELRLCPFSGDTDRALEVRVGHDHKVPRLEVGATRRAPRHFETSLDHRSGDWPTTELPGSASSLHVSRERAAPSLHLRQRILAVAAQGFEIRRRREGRHHPLPCWLALSAEICGLGGCRTRSSHLFNATKRSPNCTRQSGPVTMPVPSGSRESATRRAGLETRRTLLSGPCQPMPASL